MTDTAWFARIGAHGRLAAALCAAVAVLAVQPGSIAAHTQVVASWDVGVVTYLALAWLLIVRGDARDARRHGQTQDQSGYAIFLFVVIAAFASIIAIGYLAGTLHELAAGARAWHLALTIIALLSSWLLIQTVFAFHYAHRYYGAAHADPAAPAGLEFPGGRDPDYMDFAYYAFVVGMTSQVSDVPVASRDMRRLTLVHGFLAFVFNIAVLALSINIIASVL